MTEKKAQSKPVWQWKSNSDPWSDSDEATWTNFSSTESNVIERAYQNNEKKAEIDRHFIDFKRNIQINKSDKTRQRPTQRVVPVDSKASTPRPRFLVSEKPVKSYSNEFDHFCLIVAEWLYRNKDKLDVGYATWVEEAAASILKEENQWSEPEDVAHIEVVKKLRTVKDLPLAEIIKCCIYLYTLESFLYKAVNLALRDRDVQSWCGYL